VRAFILSSGLAIAVVACAGGSARSPLAASMPALHTLPRLRPPRLLVTHPARGDGGGYVFIAEKGGKAKPSGAVIADDRGRIRWYHQVPQGLEATDFRAQTLDGRPVLTWWQGRISRAGVGEGVYVICNVRYAGCRTLHAGHGLVGDLHEFQLTPRGTAYVSVYAKLPRDLTAVGGPKGGWVYDSIVQELDAHTGKVVFEWHSVDHVPLGESLQANEEPARHASRRRPLDYFHLNSIADAPGGRILVSGRNTSALYLIARDGRVVWRLGGKRSDFSPPSAVKFRFQHNARFHGRRTISLFDNGAIPKLEPYSRPLVLQLDVSTHRVRVVRTFVHPRKISSPYEGNLQLLPSGGAFVGWGGVPKVTQFTRNGRVSFELKLPYGDTYRAYRLWWAGSPVGGPRAVAVGDTVYASWNGNLRVVRWRVSANGATIATDPWRGLETAIAARTSARRLVVTALDAEGRPLGSARIDR
jgi:hypothetical protein